MQKQRQLIPRSLLSFPLAHFPSYWEEGDEDLNLLFPQTNNEPSGLGISEDKDSVTVEAALPGLKENEIEISVEKGVLFIKGDRNEIEEDKDKKIYRRATRSFSYRVSLPGQIDEHKEPTAVYKDGMLQVKFPKTTQPEAKKITIKKSS